VTVRVVTDSSAHLPAKTLAASGLSVVPLTVALAGEEHREGVDITAADVAHALGERRSQVTTSRPAPAEFSRTYEELLTGGATGVVSVHLSARLSGTYESALLAAEEFGGRVRVVDSLSAGTGVGFVALAAVAAAQSGADVEAVRAAALAATTRITTFFYVDTLEHLRRGGRMSLTQALVGTAFAVKPILHTVRGEVVLKEKVRTSSRALARLADLTVEAADGAEAVDVAVQHLASPERAAGLLDEITSRLGATVHEASLTEVSAAIAAHTGPDILAVALYRRP
jgi:DegV family protein with EDD domain